jgi:succinate dehydrogenase/fumarate reductase flavoprotein subunit
MANDADVIVVGGGGSGLATAVSAAQHGLKVFLLEKQPQLGGTTGIAVGSFTANRTQFQQRAGIADSLDAHAEDAGQFASAEIESRNHGQLRRFFLDHSAETLAWLTELGLHFHGPSPEPPNRVPRMHNVVPGAKAYIATLQAHLLKLGGTILCNVGVEELVRHGDRITGVIINQAGERRELLACRGVVLAAGDYANSPELIARFKGDRFTGVEGINPFATGDGHRLAELAGAQLLNMDVTYGPEIRFVPPRRRTFQQLLPASGPFAKLLGAVLPLVPQFVLNALIRRLLVTWQHPENALFDDGAILVNQRGERFCSERVWPDREIAIAQQADKTCYIVLDRRLIERYSQWPHFISTAPKIAYAYVNDYLRLRPDVATRATTVAQLAKQRSLDPEALCQTIETVNAARSQRGEAPLAGNDWILLGPAKAYFTTTEGGVAINEQFQVLDLSGAPISGLYAVGQVGLGGQILWGHGLHIAWAITSGRLCGRGLAA